MADFYPRTCNYALFRLRKNFRRYYACRYTYYKKLRKCAVGLAAWTLAHFGDFNRRNDGIRTYFTRHCEGVTYAYGQSAVCVTYV